MTDKALDSVKSIQLSYMAIYEEFLGDDFRSTKDLSDSDTMEYIERQNSSSSLHIPCQGTHLTPFEYRLFNFTRAITDFWESNKTTLSDALKQCPGSRIQFPYAEYSDSLERDTKKLASYFDSVVLLDNLMYWSRDFDIGQNFFRRELTVNFRKAAMIYRLKELVLLDADAPIVVILPAVLNCDDTRTYAYSRSLVERMFPACFEEAKSVLQIVAAGFDEQKATRILEIGKNNEMFRRILSDFDVTPLSRALIDFNSNSVKTLYSHLRELPPVLFLNALLTNVHLWFNTYLGYQSGAFAYGNDLVVGRRMWELHKWHLETSARENFSGYSFSREELSAMAILQPDMEFLGDISVEELRTLRAHQGLSTIRAHIEVERSILKSMSIEQFTATAKDVAGRLLAAITQYETELHATLLKQRERERRGFLSLGLAACMGVASIAVPVLGVPATVIGLLAGTQSLRGVINDHLSRKKAQQDTLARPIGLLYQVYRRRKGASGK
jgi:hypothetical protein